MRPILCFIGNVLSSLYARVLLMVVVRKTVQTDKRPKIFVANHPNTLDPFYLLGILGERVSILIIEHVFRIPVVGRLVKRAGHIKVTNDGARVYREAKKTLLGGRSLLIFSEGEISDSPYRLRRFHTGAVRLARETGVPIVPIGIHLDARKIWKRDTVIKNKPLVITWYRYGWYTVVFGTPFVLSGSCNNHALIRKETAALRHNVIACIHEAKSVGAEDRTIHKRTAKVGLHIALRGVYRFACFAVFIFLKLNEIGGRMLG